jgi:hypothetical protein
VPGLPPNLKIHLVTQVDPGPSSSRLSVLEYVLDLHTERKQALEERERECYPVISCPSVMLSAGAGQS